MTRFAWTKQTLAQNVNDMTERNQFKSICNSKRYPCFPQSHVTRGHCIRQTVQSRKRHEKLDIFSKLRQNVALTQTSSRQERANLPVKGT